VVVTLAQPPPLLTLVAPHPRRRQYQHQKNVKQLKIVSHYAGVSPIAVLPVKMAIAILPIPPLSLPTDAIPGETGVLVCLDKIPVVLVPSKATPARLAFVPTPQILISTKSPVLSQIKLKSRHFENYPISGNQKPLRAFFTHIWGYFVQCDYTLLRMTDHSCGCSQPPGGGGGGGRSNTTSLSLQLLDPNLNVITPPVRPYCPPTPTPSPYRSPTPTPTIRCYSHITPFGPTRILVTTCPTYPHPLLALSRQATMPVFTDIHPFAKSAATQLLVSLLPVNKMSPMPTSKESRKTVAGVFLTLTTFLPSLASPPFKTKTSKKATTCPTAKTTLNSKTATPGVKRFPQATAL
jgi:hypothetical protein